MDSPYIGRIVTLIAPLIAGLSLFTVNGVQDALNVSLDGDELTALLTAAVLGAFGVVYKWLDNRGKYERETLGQ